MDEGINNSMRSGGEDPKEFFKRLPRRAVKPKGEDPKDFLRRMSALRRRDAANPGPGQQPGPDAP
jgi:hypothetical protein